MFQHTYTKEHLLALHARGAQYLSVQKHERRGIPANTVLGWHKSHDAACRRAGSSEYTSVCDIDDAIEDAFSPSDLL